MAEGKQVLKKQLSQTSTSTTPTKSARKAIQRIIKSATNRKSSSLSLSDVDLSTSPSCLKSNTKNATSHSDSTSNRSSLCLRPHSADSSISSTFCFSHLGNQKCKLIKMICSFRFSVSLFFCLLFIYDFLNRKLN
jgi:hypothetical protein